MKKITIIVLLLFFPSLFLRPASPAVHGESGLFEIAYPFTLAKGLFGITFGVDNIDLKTADIDVNKFIVGLGWGVMEKMELNLNLSYHRVHMLEPGQQNSEYPFSTQWQTGLGYAELGIKYNFLKSDKTGLGLRGQVAVPLSDEETAITTGKAHFGLALLFAHKFNPKTIFSLNSGYQLYSDPDTAIVSDIFHYAAGIETAISGPLAAALQISGKIYTDSSLNQDNPLDLIVGLKYQTESGFGFGVGYKKNILFNNKSLGDSHGGIGYITYFPEKKKEKPAELVKLESAAIIGEGYDTAKVGEVREYHVSTSPANAAGPITYAWSTSEDGTIQGGQGSSTVTVKWEKANPNAWVKAEVSNPSSQVSAKIKVNVVEPLLPPKDEFFFGFNGCDVTPDLFPDLDVAVAYFKYHPEVNIEIEGHTCSIATNEYNLALGECRAKAVEKYFIDHGINPTRIVKTVSYGEEKPSYDNSQEETRKMNRRVKVFYGNKGE